MSYWNNNAIYFDVEHMPKSDWNFLDDNDLRAKVYSIQANNQIMSGYFCIGFIDFMLNNKRLAELTRLNQLI